MSAWNKKRLEPAHVQWMGNIELVTELLIRSDRIRISPDDQFEKQQFELVRDEVLKRMVK